MSSSLIKLNSLLRLLETGSGKISGLISAISATGSRLRSIIIRGSRFSGRKRV